MSWTAKDIPDQSGKTVVVTGANGGLGLEATREFTRKGAHVVMAVRNLEKAERAHYELKNEIPTASLEICQLDLSSLESVHRFVDEVTAEHDSVDVLLNNAGIMATPARKTTEGFESQVGTNHFGHFVLTAGLTPALKKAKTARVVTMTSGARLQGRPLKQEYTHLTDGYDAWQAYGDSKLANYQFGIELARRLKAAGSSVSSLVAHPGLSHTDLQTTTHSAGGAGRAGRFYVSAARWVGMSAARGALPGLRAATDPNAKNGEFYGPRFGIFGAPVRRRVTSRSAPADATKQMWKITEAETGTAFNVDSTNEERVLT